jgi:SAM-dependent methyltransferase
MRTNRPTPIRHWNHNVHYHRVVLAAIPSGAQRALDVGCGEAFLAQELAARIPHVVAVDRDAPILERARQRAETAPIEFVEADFLEHEFSAGSFDLVASVAALHHVPMQPALVRMAELLRPGAVHPTTGSACDERERNHQRDERSREEPAGRCAGRSASGGSDPGLPPSLRVGRDRDPNPADENSARDRRADAARSALPPPRPVAILARVDEAELTLSAPSGRCRSTRAPRRSCRAAARS